MDAAVVEQESKLIVFEIAIAAGDPLGVLNFLDCGSWEPVRHPDGRDGSARTNLLSRCGHMTKN